MMEWKDTTSYSRGQDRVPSAWQTTAGDLRIAVVRKHIHAPGTWVMHCEPWFATYPIGPDTMSEEDAKANALSLLRGKIAETARALGMR
jgi:hypothetical protein